MDSDTEELFNAAECDMKSNTTYKKYPAFQAHIEEDVLPRKDSWSLLFRIREKLPTSSVNTTNYVESSFRWTKECQFNRHRAYNMLDLLKVIMDDSQYHAFRDMDVLYAVNMELWLNVNVKCYLGQVKDPFKHKSIVSTTQIIPSFDVVLTENPEMRAVFMFLGTGKKT